MERMSDKQEMQTAVNNIYIYIYIYTMLIVPKQTRNCVFLINKNYCLFC